MRTSFRVLVAVTSLLFAAACGEDPVEPPPPPDYGNATFKVRESVEQLHVTHAVPGTELVVVDPSGAEVARGVADKLGSLMFRKLAPGEGYLVRAPGLDPVEERKLLKVMSLEESWPEPAKYKEQKLTPGFQYLTMRDGTTLSAYVTLPAPANEGPFPTIVNYSGYDPSKPGEPLDGGKYADLCPALPVLCDAPTDPSALIAAAFGYATVSVNIRGTGCSGGAYDYFETMQILDGYDVVEIVAAQDWVLHHQVGMTGLSYPGISQLFVAQVQPPGLAAITPLSVIGGTSTTLVPGGILNDGFAINWVRSVLNKAASYGQGWEQARVDGGDTVCEENQLLHDQRVDNVAQAYATPFYDEAIVAPLDPERFVSRIKVPVFLAGGFQDEQTGPYFPALFDKMTSAPVKRFTVYNGVHVDGFSPAVLAEWKAFLDLYVARRLPVFEEPALGLAPMVFEQIFGSKLKLPPNRFAKYSTWEEAKAAFEAEPEVRVLYEVGAGDSKDPGAPLAGFEKAYARWPIPGVKPLRLYFQPDGSLAAAAPTVAASASKFDLDPEAGGRGILPKGSPWDKQPNYDWKQPAPGKAVVFVSEPLTTDHVMLGTASVDFWIRSPVDDADLEVNLSEVRPDGQEQYIQSGWLRASQRALSPTKATELWPEHTHAEVDAQPLPAGEWTQVRVGIAPFSHVFRAGSRIRIAIDTPGDSRVDWRFLLKKFPQAVSYDIAHDAAHPSSVALPLIEETVPTPMPPSGSLRGQQCRTFEAYANTPAQ